MSTFGIVLGIIFCAILAWTLVEILERIIDGIQIKKEK